MSNTVRVGLEARLGGGWMEKGQSTGAVKRSATRMRAEVERFLLQL